MVEPKFEVKMTQVDEMQFKAEFDVETWEPVFFDEPESVPGGKGQFPNASRYLAAAILNCLSASLNFCLMKSRIPADGIVGQITGTISRNENGRWRIVKLEAKLKALYGEIDETIRKKFERCKELFFDFCIVSASIKEGTIDLSVETEIAKTS